MAQADLRKRPTSPIKDLEESFETTPYCDGLPWMIGDGKPEPQWRLPALRYFRGASGVQVAQATWRPTANALPDGSPRGVVFCCHGYSNHMSQTWAGYAAHFTEMGLLVAGIDFEGHGLSMGTQALFHDVSTLVVPVKDVLPDCVAEEAKADEVARNPFRLHGWPRLATSVALLNMIERLQSRLGDVETPWICLHAKSDVVTAPQNSETLFKESKSTDKTLVWMQGAKHVVCWEPVDTRRRIFDRLTQWLADRIAQPDRSAVRVAEVVDVPKGTAGFPDHAVVGDNRFREGDEKEDAGAAAAAACGGRPASPTAVEADPLLG